MMAISADKLLTRSVTVTLKKSGETVNGSDTSLLIIKAKGDVERVFKLEEPRGAGHFLAVVWDDDNQGTLSNTKPMKMADHWFPNRHDSILLVSTPNGWTELSRSTNI